MGFKALIIPNELYLLNVGILNLENLTKDLVRIPNIFIRKRNFNFKLGK
jgi:hypothetical protein